MPEIVMDKAKAYAAGEIEWPELLHWAMTYDYKPTDMQVAKHAEHGSILGTAWTEDADNENGDSFDVWMAAVMCGYITSEEADQIHEAYESRLFREMNKETPKAENMGTPES